METYEEWKESWKKHKIVEEEHNDYLLLHGMKVQEEKDDVCQ